MKLEEHGTARSGSDGPAGSACHQCSSRVHYITSLLLHYTVVTILRLNAGALLLRCGANVKLANAKRETPFDVATRLGHTEIAERLAAGFAQKNLERLVQPPPPAASEP